MAAPLVAAGVAAILRFIASKGTQAAVKKYGKTAVDGARKAGQQAQKEVARKKAATSRADLRKARGSQAAARKGDTKGVTPTAGVPKTTAAGRAAAQKRIDAAKAGPKKAAAATVAGATLLGGAAAMKPAEKKKKQETKVDAPKKRPLAADRETASKMPSSYSVKKGDTLSAIAKRYGVRLSELRDANKNIKDLNKISVGQKINLPKESIKGTGKSVYEGMSKAEMRKLAMKKGGYAKGTKKK